MLKRGCVRSLYCLDSVLQSLHLLLPATPNLESHFQWRGAFLRLPTECTKLVLQHGARIDYSDSFLEISPICFEIQCRKQKQHSEEFIKFLRAADTNFSCVPERIASLDRTEWKLLNLDVLEDKLSQPLTLQTSCVISVRRRLRSISDVRMWARIDALPLPTALRDRLKLLVW